MGSHNSLKQLQNLFSEGIELLRAGNADLALSCFQKIQAVDPSNPTLLLYAGAALHELKRFSEAVICYQKAIVIAPRMGEIHNNLGNSLIELGLFCDAAQSFTRAISLLSPSPVPFTARATALQALGKVAAAEEDCRKAISLDPTFAAAHWNLALNLLLQGEYRDGWREYEWRWQKADFTSPSRHTDIPLWNGSPLHGQNILLHAEQGFGDAIQFVRYVPLVAACGGNVVLECHPQLVSLFRSIKEAATVVSFNESVPVCSYQVPLLTLPRIFGTTLQNIPSTCPYLTVSVERQRKWSALMSTYCQSPRIGIVWAGKSYPDPLRSCCLADFAPVAEVGSATYFSLQLGSGAEEVNKPPPGMQLIDLTDHINDFADTAALIEQLDLIVSIDTAVAHLAGALGKPVFLLLPYAPDWRWLLDRSDSPWYPTARLFRQERPGDWSGVVRHVQRALMSCCDKMQNPSKPVAARDC